MKRRLMWSVAAVGAVFGWRRARSSRVVSLRKLANAEGVTTWSAWRRGRVG